LLKNSLNFKEITCIRILSFFCGSDPGSGSASKLNGSSALHITLRYIPLKVVKLKKK